jgi:PAS domain S-box-containing protein
MAGWTDDDDRGRIGKTAILELTLDAMEQGISVVDADLNVVVFNRRFLDILGLPTDRFRPGDPFETFIRYNAERGDYGPGAVEEQVQSRLALARSPAPHCFERTRPDGTVIEIRGTPIPGGGFLTTYTDTTERKRREEDLAAAIRDKDGLLAEFNTVMQTIGYGVMFLGPDLRVRLANRAFREMWHFPDDLLAGRTEWRALMQHVAARGLYAVPAEELPHYLERRYKEVLAGDIAPRDLRLSDGRIFEYQCKGLPDGGRMVTYFDITDYRRTEQALKQSEQRFRDFTSSSSDWVWEMGPDLRFTHFSDRALIVFKLKREQIIGKTREEVGQRSLDSAAWQQHMDDLRAHRPFKNFRYPMTNAEGKMLWVSTSGLPLFSDDGAFLGYRGTASDVTFEVQREHELRDAKDRAERALAELKRAQTNLVHAEKLALLGQLVAGIAHEIKNPLNFVNNFASLSIELLDELRELLEGWRAGRTPDQRGQIEDLFATIESNLGKIREHGSRADGIVKSMLAHSREGPGERRSIDINALVEESLGLAYHGARAQDSAFNATLERDLDPEAGAVEVVPQDLSRVLLNLFANGFYAMQERIQRGAGSGYRPTLRVASRRLHSAVEIRVRDNGIGIAAPVLEKIFTPFYTTKPAGQGTGLGLSLSYDVIVHQHGGVFEVDTREGEYTEFVVRLPCNADGRPAAAGLQ